MLVKFCKEQASSHWMTVTVYAYLTIFYAQQDEIKRKSQEEEQQKQIAPKPLENADEQQTQ